MKIRKAKLIRLTTLDGWHPLRDGVPLGREYLVDVDSIEKMGHADDEHTIPVMREFIMAYNAEDGVNPLGWFPLEMLEVSDEPLSIDQIISSVNKGD